MSVLTQKDLRHPINSANAKKLRGKIGQHNSFQATAANDAGTSTQTLADHNGKPLSVFAVLQEAFGTGESLAVDVTADGSSILSGGPITLDENSPVGEQIELPLDPNGDISIGDTLLVVRSGYVAGGGAAEPANLVGIEWA